MQKLIEDISSVYWWLGVVLVGIIINIFSSYLKNKLDLYMGNISKKWARISEDKKARFNMEVDIIRKNPEQLNLTLFDEIRTRIKAGLFCCLSAITFLGAIIMTISPANLFYLKYILTIVAFIFWIIYLNSSEKANETKAKIDKASNSKE